MMVLWSAKFYRIFPAVRATFFDAQRGFFRTQTGDPHYHELTQNLAVNSGTAENTEILDRLSEHHELVKSTLSTSIFKYEALLAANAQYQDAVLEEIADIWGRMLFAGADTLWEVEEGGCGVRECWKPLSWLVGYSGVFAV